MYSYAQGTYQLGRLFPSLLSNSAPHFTQYFSANGAVKYSTVQYVGGGCNDITIIQSMQHAGKTYGLYLDLVLYKKISILFRLLFNLLSIYLPPIGTSGLARVIFTSNTMCGIPNAHAILYGGPTLFGELKSNHHIFQIIF